MMSFLISFRSVSLLVFDRNVKYICVYCVFTTLFTHNFHCFSLTGKDESTEITGCKAKKVMTVKSEKAAKANQVPLTGTEVVHPFAEKRGLGEWEPYYLTDVDTHSHRYTSLK